MARVRRTVPASRPRRRWLAGLLLAMARTAGAGPPKADVWVELSEPVAAETTDAAERQRRRQRVAEQQRAIAAHLQELGVVELARTQHTRNAIAVRVDAREAELVRRLPGVVRLRPARSLHPPEPGPER